jgi:Ca2+-transporting ATPase
MKDHLHHSGLNDQEVKQSRDKYGENVLTPPEKEPMWKLFLEKFEDPIIRILLIAAFLSLGISFIHMEFAETIGIFFAIFLATGVGFWFEMDANKKFDVLNQVKDDTLYKVIRNSDVREVPKREIVVGDIVVLATGEEVPADGELIEAVALQMDESCLTGEPIIDKTIDPEHFHAEATYPSNWAMRGTKVMEGHGIIRVNSVGDETEFGKVAEKATEMSGEETPLNKQLDRLAKFIGVAGFSLALLTFIALFLKDLLLGEVSYSFSQLSTVTMVLLSVAIALTKIWMPIVYDAFHLMGKDKKLPKVIEKGSWFKWLLYGILVFIIQAGAGYLAGIQSLLPEAWIDIDTAGRILQYFMVAVTLIVVAIPEGLPMSVTLSLALSMRRMLQNNNLVRKMHATETMGATTVICTDKTGTLTQNQMQVYKTNFFALKDQKLVDNEISSMVKEGISTNSTAFLDHSEEKVKALGNPTEGALLLWLDKQGVDYMSLRESAQVKEQLTFSTQRKYMATVVYSPYLKKRVLYIKGAPEIVLGLCKQVHTEQGMNSATAMQSQIDELLLAYQNQAMRTLGFAYEIIEDDKNRVQDGELVNATPIFMGITAISDPVRKDVPHAVDQCLNAGIEVKIVTGDTPGTAREIGRQIGIWKSDDKEESIITGTEFEQLSDEEAAQRVQKLKIMCRARPTDKQRLVQLLQKSGSIVAVTGDGTNDAPALNYAHVGLSMGSGTSVAKEASDITLLDDSFSSITTAVMWGRSLYRNIQRFLLFQLTINVAAVFIVLLGSIFGHELPLTVTQMLWVNLIMDTFAAGALASLPPDMRVMSEKPRRNTAFIINPQMRFIILFVGISFVIILLGLLYYFNMNGAISRYDLSMFFTLFVMLQFWNMFNAKAYATGKSAFHDMKKSYGFLLVALVILLGQFIIVEIGGDVFRTVPLKVMDWVYIIVGSSFVLWIGEIYRLLNRGKN